MSEKLLPWDASIARREPERVRDADGNASLEVHVFATGVVAALWNVDWQPSSYSIEQAKSILRIAAKTREVTMQAYVDGDGSILAIEADEVTPLQKIGEPFTVTVPEEE